MATIGKITQKTTKEAMAQKIFSSIPDEKREDLYILLGKIVTAKVKNVYSTKSFRNLTEDLTYEQRAVVSFLCQRAATVKLFANMEKLILTEGK